MVFRDQRLNALPLLDAVAIVAGADQSARSRHSGQHRRYSSAATTGGTQSLTRLFMGPAWFYADVGEGSRAIARENYSTHTCNAGARSTVKCANAFPATPSLVDPVVDS